MTKILMEFFRMLRLLPALIVTITAGICWAILSADANNKTRMIDNTSPYIRITRRTANHSIETRKTISRPVNS